MTHTVVYKPDTYSTTWRLPLPRNSVESSLNHILATARANGVSAISTIMFQNNLNSYFSMPIIASSTLSLPTSHGLNPDFRVKSLNWVFSGALALALSVTGNFQCLLLSFIHAKVELNYEAMFIGVGLAEAKVGVNKPELLPREFTPVIDVAGFLSDGQEKRLAQEISDIEKDTGFKLRVLAQNYPDTPGLAIKDFWQVDDRTIVFVADPTFGNILNFNVGATVDLDIPRSFWSRLAGKYGNMFYWKEKGEDASIEAAVMAISNCLREPVGPNNCSEVK
ncbi:hypothetical protein V6N13_072766 [Hibiscus sabdariffa]|uniref:TPM domain-containing protein n=1 Tax=Hibiscus sabdariffa TaxID=183260 RepID=A0ABR2E756_9ROSI